MSEFTSKQLKIALDELRLSKQHLQKLPDSEKIDKYTDVQIVSKFFDKVYNTIKISGVTLGKDIYQEEGGFKTINICNFGRATSDHENITICTGNNKEIVWASITKEVNTNNLYLCNYRVGNTSVKKGLADLSDAVERYVQKVGE